MTKEFLKFAWLTDKICSDLTEVNNYLDEEKKKLTKIKATTIIFEAEKLETSISKYRK